MNTFNPVSYEAWYHTPRGHWVGRQEFLLLRKLLQASADETLLDVGCGTGYFSRLFSPTGIQVTGLDPDRASLLYARTQSDAIDWVPGDAQTLPFADNCFDYCMAVTSLCFVANPAQALKEMLRVARKGVVLGLLNRHSLLYHQKKGKGAYVGARWDSSVDVLQWVSTLKAKPLSLKQIYFRSAIFIPNGGIVARCMEQCLSSRLRVGGFLACSFLLEP